MTETTSRATPVLADLLQIEPGDHTFASLPGLTARTGSAGLAIQVGTEFLATKEAQIQARLARLEADLTGSEELPDAHLLADQAADALRALLDLLKPDVAPTAPPPRYTPAPTPLDGLQPQAVTLPAPRQRGLQVALGLALSAWLITLAAFAWLLWKQAGIPANRTAVVTTVLVSPSSVTPGREPQAAEAALPAAAQSGGELPTATPLSTAMRMPQAPSIPGSEARLVESVRAAQLQIPDDSGASFLQIPLAVMAERINVDDDKPVLRVELPATGGGLYRASVPFGEKGAMAIALPARAAPDNLQAIRPGDRLTGCNADGRCYDYRVTAAETWDRDHLDQVLTAWPYDLNLLIYTILEGGDAWIIEAELEDQSP